MKTKLGSANFEIQPAEKIANGIPNLNTEPVMPLILPIRCCGVDSWRKVQIHKLLIVLNNPSNKRAIPIKINELDRNIIMYENAMSKVVTVVITPVDHFFLIFPITKLPINPPSPEEDKSNPSSPSVSLKISFE